MTWNPIRWWKEEEVERAFWDAYDAKRKERIKRVEAMGLDPERAVQDMVIDLLERVKKLEEMS